MQTPKLTLVYQDENSRHHAFSIDMRGKESAKAVAFINPDALKAMEIAAEHWHNYLNMTDYGIGIRKQINAANDGKEES